MKIQANSPYKGFQLNRTIQQQKLLRNNRKIVGKPKGRQLEDENNPKTIFKSNKT